MDKETTVKRAEIRDIEIRTVMEADGYDSATVLADVGIGDDRVVVYAYGGIRVASTNGQAAWEESCPCEFADLLVEAGCEI